MDAGIQSQGGESITWHCVSIERRALGQLPSLALDSGIHAGMTNFSALAEASKGSNNLIPYASIWMLENAENHGLKLKEGWRDRLEGNPAGAIHESRAGFWKIWPPVTPLSLS
jgi:hypothetical protein